MRTLNAYLHGFLYRLFHKSDAFLAREAFDATRSLFLRHRLVRQEDRDVLIRNIALLVEDRIEPAVGVGDEMLIGFIRSILDYEGMFVLPDIDWSRHRSTSEYWEIRESVLVQCALCERFDDTLDVLCDCFADVIGAVAAATPQQLDRAERGLTVPTDRLDLLAYLPHLVEAVLFSCIDEALERRNLLPRLRDRLEGNVISASGGNPADRHNFNRALKLPTKSDISDRPALIGTYLGGTPLVRLFEGDVRFTIPERTRFEHHHIVAGSGHGKTQALQYMIAHDLEAVKDGNASVVVLDSQGDLIRTISQLQCFAPGEPLHERICIIDPSDVEYPVSLNLFDVGIERLQHYPMLERERLTNSVLELYDFVLGSLLDAGMTQKQSVIFRYVTRLMLHIPDATIHTLRELMEPTSAEKFAPHIAKLTGTARQFFETEFASREFNDTKKQVLRRLWGILENQTFERMFSHPRSKLDLFAEMNAGRVILINTAKDLLKETGTEIFGRFFIALIAQAAQERAVLPERQRLPTFVYIDEAADYFDRNIGLILSQARKFNIGMVLAHQYLGQLDPKLQEAFGANTAIKFAGGVSNKDARALAPMLGCSPEFIEIQGKGSFAASVRGTTEAALPLRFPLGHMERMPRMNAEEREALQHAMRRQYAVHISNLHQGDAEAVHADQEDEPPDEGGEGGPDTDASPSW